MPSIRNEYIFKGELKTDKYTYNISIQTSSKTNIIYSRYFSIGSYVLETGEKKTCVDIYVMYPEFKKEIPTANYKIANLITTHYNEKCSVDEKLERGTASGEVNHILNTAMYFVSKICPFIEGFDLNDASTRQCDNDTNIVLSYFSITQYQKTWYEKHFNAYIPDRVKRSKYETIVTELMLRKLPEWDTFDAIFLRNVETNVKLALKSIAQKSTTYKELFRNIHAEGISRACVLLQPWIEKLMLPTTIRNYVLFTQWVIPIESVKRIPLVNYKKDFVGRLENY